MIYKDAINDRQYIKMLFKTFPPTHPRSGKRILNAVLWLPFFSVATQVHLINHSNPKSLFSWVQHVRKFLVFWLVERSVVQTWTTLAITSVCQVLYYPFISLWAACDVPDFGHKMWLVKCCHRTTILSVLPLGSCRNNMWMSSLQWRVCKNRRAEGA